MTAAPANPHQPPQVLGGMRVLDFSHVIAGPFATFHLAQMGAQVTKVEKPGGGDVMRRTPSGERAFTALNAGKQALAIDIATEAGRAQALALAREADVMVDNYRPGVLQRHGLGWEQVREANPRIIYCAISGYGYGDAARTRQGAYDHVIQALTGVTLQSGTEGAPPVKTGFPMVDAATGMVATMAVLAALRERDQTGRGCFLDVSMWAASLQLMYTFACEALSTGQDAARVGNKGFSGSPAADTFQCADGWLALGANTPAHIARLVQVLGIPQQEVAPLLEPEGQDGPAFARARDPQAFQALLARHLAQASAAQVEARLNAVGVPAARVRTVAEFCGEAVASGMLQPLALGEGPGQALSPGLGWRVLR